MFFRLFIFIFVGTAVSCGDANHQESSRLSVVYGEDDRIEIAEAPEWKFAAQAVGKLFYKDICHETPTQIQVPTSTFTPPRYCSSFPFQGQSGFGVCTGFLVGPDTFVTAGHCIRHQADCENYYLTFDHVLENRNFEKLPATLTLPRDEVYHCKKLVYRKFEKHGEDIAVIKIDRKREVHLEVQEDLNENMMPNTISHPFGFAKKLSSGVIKSIENNAPQFRVQIDFARVGSGSPLFDRNSKALIGMLVGGTRDTLREQSGCMAEKRCAQDDCPGERVLKASVIKEILAHPYNSSSSANWGGVIP